MKKHYLNIQRQKNILDSLPKTLRRLNFEVEPVSDLILEKDKKSEKNVITNNNYIISDTIEQWIEKFGICDDILKEAQKRREELNRELSEVDKAFSNIVHKIELEDKIDMYGAWKELKHKITGEREEK